ncbi:6-phosphogluconolactonase [Brevirhabdus pacifica]|uniref:6-phosphogluconolactonase n=1 Tax=Brevirhabdus pacifica TaxID=1267768 RepID=A0A1U7DEW4_9RHOB|nr:6-phosphogluconolactonase [Brevirhabdus pacifica]APX88512.1 6-phosphogluconolactonase [Brevirhabdus pacifica]OWU79812.1 6-phosphogluconolactonase [Loktanella sp. 22II-4b]PJJ87008.1 6-phosphogluconolactonase [Brevirhabdus pacifica]
MEFVKYPDRELLMMDLATRLAGELRNALRGNDRATFCVPGGNTPGPVYDTICGIDMDWSRISVVLNDERWVPESSPRSNTRLLKARLLRDYAARATLVPLYREGMTPEEAAPELSEDLAPHLPISVLLLGMGEDMHTASLIPGAEGLAEAMADRAPAVLPIRVAGEEEARVTLSLPVLCDAMSTHVIITGADKREALERAQKTAPDAAPIRPLLSNATVHWAE